ncbi:hypothetical protein M2347_003773 [Chryseobacterium sp. H1D6B]|uniref:tetratricopeptide repeat protein n=1 Tax=Chryseobacterium sp. H1D6B TaxID=2940588 RepID=UPI0015C91A89|nr:tetratricopeptide repeat protein [Chryseobacterium sp. H1D6B]MDH6254046.1 hypothetical protein [Chryseobacterium sp. H1D6B]
MRKFLLLLFLILSSPLLFSQIDMNFLKGEWIVYKKEMKDGSTYFSQEVSTTPREVYVFNKASFFTKDYIKDADSSFPIPVKIVDQYIITNESRYKVVEKLTESELIFIEVFAGKKENYLIRYYLKKYAVQQKLDLAENISKDTLSTTAVLSPLPKKNIFKDKANEYDANFKTKGYLLFDMENKQVKSFFTDTKNISKQNRDKILSIFNSSFDFWNFNDVKKFKFIRMPFIIIGYQYSLPTATYSHITPVYNVENYNEIITYLNNEDIQDSDKYFKIASNCFENKNYECALQNFNESSKKNKYNLDAHYNYASICIALGKKDDACAKLTELVSYGQKTAEEQYKLHCIK